MVLDVTATDPHDTTRRILRTLIADAQRTIDDARTALRQLEGSHHPTRPAGGGVTGYAHPEQWATLLAWCASRFPRGASTADVLTAITEDPDPCPLPLELAAVNGSRTVWMGRKFARISDDGTEFDGWTVAAVRTKGGRWLFRGPRTPAAGHVDVAWESAAVDPFGVSQVWPISDPPGWEPIAHPDTAVDPGDPRTWIPTLSAPPVEVLTFGYLGPEFGNADGSATPGEATSPADPAVAPAELVEPVEVADGAGTPVSPPAVVDLMAALEASVAAARAAARDRSTLADF